MHQLANVLTSKCGTSCSGLAPVCFASATGSSIFTVCTSLLQKKEVHTFHVFTGNTNEAGGATNALVFFVFTVTFAPSTQSGGKSMLLALINAAFETLFGLLPITAITGRESDPSGHTDYLARTQGMSLCVCHEPDSRTQQIYPGHGDIR